MIDMIIANMAILQKLRDNKIIRCLLIFSVC